MNRSILLFLFCITTTILVAQQSEDCEQLAIQFHGFVKFDGENKLFIEVSNALYTGSLYYYPGFMLISEQGDTIAKEKTSYYGIGSNFQSHFLDIKSGFSVPFNGRLELFGSYYQNFFCSFPITIEEIDFVNSEKIERETVKILFNYAGDHLIVDMGNIYHTEEQLRYHLKISKENWEQSYYSELTDGIIAIPISAIGESGNYFVSIWDEQRETVLVNKKIRIE